MLPGFRPVTKNANVMEVITPDINSDLSGEGEDKVGAPDRSPGVGVDAGFQPKFLAVVLRRAGGTSKPR